VNFGEGQNDYEFIEGKWENIINLLYQTQTNQTK